MRRFIFLGSLALFALAATSLLATPTAALMSRGVATLLIALVLCVYTLVLWRFFRTTSMSKREKVIAWLSVGFVICAWLGVQGVGILAYPIGFSVALAWHAFWLALASLFVALARLVAHKRAAPRPPSYTVASEAPDHVVNIGSRT